MNTFKEIDALIKARMSNDVEEIYPVYDGIVNDHEYSNAKYKILWILKEPHDKDGGNWYMKDFIGNKDRLREYRNWPRTFNPIIYVTYSILNGFSSWNELDDTSENPDMIDVLRKIAYINLKKIPGETVSVPDVIQKAYEENKDIILKQIELCDPNMIIGGSTMSIIANDLGIGPLIEKNGIKCFATNEKIYIDAYHPNQKSIPQQIYCDSIINTIKDWATSKK